MLFAALIGGRLCDLFGRRLIFQPFGDRVVIAKLGEGTGLPGGVGQVDHPTQLGDSLGDHHQCFRYALAANSTDTGRDTLPGSSLTWKASGPPPAMSWP